MIPKISSSSLKDSNLWSDIKQIGFMKPRVYRSRSKAFFHVVYCYEYLSRKYSSEFLLKPKLGFSQDIFQELGLAQRRKYIREAQQNPSGGISLSVGTPPSWRARLFDGQPDSENVRYRRRLSLCPPMMQEDQIFDILFLLALF